MEHAKEWESGYLHFNPLDHKQPDTLSMICQWASVVDYRQILMRGGIVTVILAVSTLGRKTLHKY